MKIELSYFRDHWEASCIFEIEFKGRKLEGLWSTEEGYSILNWYDSDFSDDEKEELEKMLKRADTPTLGFKGGSDILEV